MTVYNKARRQVSLSQLTSTTLGAAIACGWAAALCSPVLAENTIGGVSLILSSIIAVLIIHAATSKTGSFLILWITTSLVGATALGAVVLLTDTYQTSLGLLAGISTFVYNETVRLSYAHRRQASIEPNVFYTSGAALGVLASLGIVAAQFVLLGTKVHPTEDDGTTLTPDTWWTPAAVGLLIAAFLAAMFFPAFRRPRQKLARFRPGMRVDLYDIQETEKKNEKST